jgi:hypothetical protein
MPEPAKPVKQSRADYVFCGECKVMVARKHLREAADDPFSDDDTGKVCPAGHPIPASELTPPAAGGAS